MAVKEIPNQGRIHVYPTMEASILNKEGRQYMILYPSRKNTNMSQVFEKFCLLMDDDVITRRWRHVLRTS